MQPGTHGPAVARSSQARPSVGKSMRLVRDPDAGELHVRFDERDVETELRRGYSGTARRKGRQQTNRTYCHHATSRLYRKRRRATAFRDSTYSDFRPGAVVRLPNQNRLKAVVRYRQVEA